MNWKPNKRAKQEILHGAIITIFILLFLCGLGRCEESKVETYMVLPVGTSGIDTDQGHGVKYSYIWGNDISVYASCDMNPTNIGNLNLTSFGPGYKFKLNKYFSVSFTAGPYFVHDYVEDIGTGMGVTIEPVFEYRVNENISWSIGAAGRGVRLGNGAKLTSVNPVLIFSVKY